MISRQEAPFDQTSTHADPWAAIAEPLPSGAMAWRQDGRAIERDGKYFARFVAYVEANTVRERLDSVVPGEWNLTLELLPAVPSADDADGAEANLLRVQGAAADPRRRSRGCGNGKGLQAGVHGRVQACRDAIRHRARALSARHQLGGARERREGRASGGGSAGGVRPAGGIARAASEARARLLSGGPNALDPRGPRTRQMYRPARPAAVACGTIARGSAIRRRRTSSAEIDAARASSGACRSERSRSSAREGMWRVRNRRA